MEKRKITIVETKNQRKTTIMSDAMTLAELKKDLDAVNINYNEMTFYEGLSKTELKSDSSQLPMNVQWKGNATNELVFMLTNKEKKIQSGATRREEAYIKVKEYNLGDAIKNKYGKNYTQCTTEILENAVKAYEANAGIAVEEKKNTETQGNNIKDAFITLVNILYSNDTIEDYEKEKIENILKNDTPKIVSSYSNSEIDEMFADF